MRLSVVQRRGFRGSSKFRESETTVKIKFALFRGGVGRGAGWKIVQNAIFHGKRHDNKILKAKILLSRNFVVMALAPTNIGFCGILKGVVQKCHLVVSVVLVASSVFVNYLLSKRTAFQRLWWVPGF